MAGGRTTALRTDEALWRQIVREVTAEDKGGRPGQWSARKAQICVARYKQAGGGYIGAKSPDNSLAKWTREKWRTKSGAPSLQTGERYLPSAAIEALTDEEYAETSRAKRRGMKRGQQFVPQPIEVAAKVAPYRRARKGNNTEAPSRDACLPSDLLLRKVSVLNKPDRQNMARKKRQHTPSRRTANDAPDWLIDLGHYSTFGIAPSSDEYRAEQARQQQAQEQAQEQAESERQREELASYAAQVSEEPGTEQGRGLRPGGYKDQQDAVSDQERARIYAEQARRAELAKQQAIASAWKQAEANAQAERNRREREAQMRQQATISPAKFAVSSPTKTVANMKGRRSNPASVREKISLLSKPERQNMARKYRHQNPSMRAAYYDPYDDPYDQSASEFAAEQQAAEARAQATQTEQERAMAEYNREQRLYESDEVGGTRARIDHAREQQARQQEADRQIAYERQQRDLRRGEELGKQQAIADAYRFAAGNAQAQRQGQMTRQAIQDSAKQRTAVFGSPSSARVSAQSVSFAQRAPMNLPKVGMKGRNRNPATLTNDDFLLGRIGSSPAILCKRPAVDRKGQSKHLCAILHPDDHTAFRVEVFGRGDYATMAPHMAEAPIALSNPVNKSAFTVALRRFKQQCEALVSGAAARANNPGHESGFWDQYGGDSAYDNRHAILKKALKGEWQPVNRTEVMREVRDSRGYVDDNRVRRLLSSYAAKAKSLADRCMRAEHSGQPFPVLEAKYEAAELDLEDIQTLVQELSDGRTRNPRVHHGADFDDLSGGTVVMRPVRKGPVVRRDREDIVAELVAIGSKRNRSASRAVSERSRSRVR